MTVGTILFIVLIFILIGVNPRWTYAANWGYRPSGLICVLFVVLIILVFAGYV